MSQYRINDLERLTGVKAHTIRIWEKRYELISPTRSDTNRRFYSDAQLVKLMNVSTLLEHGHKISHLAAMTDEELAVQIDHLHKYPSENTVFTAYIHDLTLAMVAFNETLFADIFADAAKKLGFYEAMINVFYPFLRKAGLLWRTDKAVPIQEHFATCIIRNKIIAATESLAPPAPDAAKYILFLPQNEWHEVALLFANYILRSKGLATIFLGQNVPYEDIDMVVKMVDPQFIFTFYITPKPVEEIAEEIARLGTSFPGQTIYISGDGSLLQDVPFPGDNLIYLRSVAEFIAIL